MSTADDRDRTPDPRTDAPPPVPPPPEPAPTEPPSTGPPSGPVRGSGGGRRTASWSDWLSPRLVIGLLIAGFGVVLFLEQFGHDLDPVLRWWPLALIAIGLIKVSQRQGRGFGIILTAVGVLFLVDSLDLLEIDDWDLLWPLAVIGVGGFLIWGGLRGGRRRNVTASDDAASFNAAAVMGGVRRQITSRAFVGGEATAVMGACEIDLTRAEMAGEAAEIEVFTMWGGIELAVPDHWQVEIRGMPVMGAFEDSTRPRTDDASKVLAIRGMALMGAVEIKSELSKSNW